MVPLTRLFKSTLGRKYLMGATGIALALFMVMHLLGNLTLYSQSGDAINLYASKLEALGAVKLALEIGLALTFFVHIVTALQVSMTSKGARAISYDQLKTKGGASKNTLTSRNMKITGLLLLVFLIIHIYQFRFGPGIAMGYTSMVKGEMIWDLHRVVVDVFSNLYWVIFYSGVMFVLGFHLRHGFWSAFQSLGCMNPRWSKPIYSLGLILALLLTFGFFFIPIYVYAVFGGGSQ